ncbi:MAG: ABC transporter ATP-binding protein [Candidatus Hodarchaeota archaeon]
MNKNEKKTINAILSIENVRKYYGYIRAVDGITLDIKRGEIYGLLGPNGAGKTTTIKCVLGLLNLESGSIQVLGKNPSTDSKAVKSIIGYVSEEPHIYKSMTPRELFNFIASIRQLGGNRATRRAQQLMESLDAMEYYDSAIVTLSRGNQQKVQIIAALLHEPELLIMDEPLSGLDARTSRIIKDLLKIHAENGGAVLLSTHVMEQASELCTRIGIINKGKLVIEGTLDELRAYVNSSGEQLENVFLKITNQDASVKRVVEEMRRRA